MSRSGYTDDLDLVTLNLYRGSVERAIRGRRGQGFLRELAEAMDAMPVKELISGELVNEDGEVCAIGVVCKSRGLDVSDVDVEEPAMVGQKVGIARSMAAEISYENDEGAWRTNEDPSQRWIRIRKWVEDNIVPNN